MKLLRKFYNEVVLRQGYAYIIYDTEEKHYGAFRVTELTDDYVVFDWVYQPDHDNPQL